MRLTPFIRPLRRLALAAGGVAAAVLLATGAPAAPRPETGQTIAAAVEVAVDGQKTRFSVLLSQAVVAHAQLMERPDRVIVDLPEVTFRLPTETGRTGQGLISSYRYGLFAPGRSRVVIDLAQPATIASIDVETGLPGDAARLVVEIVRADRESFRKAVAESAPAALPAPAAAVLGSESDKRPVVVLDPGHGGIDPGAAAAGGLAEKEIVFAFAQKLKQRLEAEGRYRVVMTRDEDVFVPLGERVRIAQRLRADLFISIHADAISGGQEVRGLTIYTGSERASDADSARLADRENKADQVAGAEAGEGSDEGVPDILQDLTLRETRAYSHGFASRLSSELDGVARMNKNPHRQAGFRVLRASDVPSVLIELGYLSSRKDLDLLVSDGWRDKATAAMAAAVNRFFATRLARQGPAAVSP